MQKFSKSIEKRSIIDGSFASIFDSITSTYLVPFAIFLGASNSSIGLITGIPRLAQSFLQPFAGHLIEKSGSRKKVCKDHIFLKTFPWLGILMLPFLFSGNFLIPLIILLSVSQVSYSIVSTAWISWFGDLVPSKLRGIFFGTRNFYIGLVTFFSTLIVGWFLGAYKTGLGFAIVFLIAIVSGLLGRYFLSKIPEPKYPQPVHVKHERTHFLLSEFREEFKKNRNFSKFVSYLTLLQFAVFFVSPFFAVYMLQTLKIGYEWYAVVTAVEVLSSVLSLKYWGKFSDRFGDRTTLGITSILITLVPFIWMFIGGSLAVVIIQMIIAGILSGFGWAGFDLSTFNYLLDSTPQAKRPVYISNFRFFTSLSLFIGPVAGGFLLDFFSSQIFLIFTGFQIMLLISFILRGSFSALFIHSLKELRTRQENHVSDLFLKAVAVYPARGVYREVQYAGHCLNCWNKKFVREVILRKT
ncbi:MAG: MFS transporter [Candidatus Aenigmarchaeota archaeon]|nr:MFS transporter [Candidatus Aenigmarchaeota archaeon]